MNRDILAIAISLGFAAVTIGTLIPQTVGADEIRETTTTVPGSTMIERREEVDTAPVVVPAPVVEENIIHDRPIVVKKHRKHLFHVGVPGAAVNVL